MDEITAAEIWNILLTCGLQAIDLRLSEWEGSWHVGITNEAGDVVIWIDAAHVERETGL